MDNLQNIRPGYTEAGVAHLGQRPRYRPEEMYHSVCFLGIDAVNIHNGIGQHNMYDVRIKQIMIENSAKVILLADHSKFTNMAFIHVAPLSQIDVIITDSRLDKSILQELDRQGIRVIIVPME